MMKRRTTRSQLKFDVLDTRTPTEKKEKEKEKEKTHVLKQIHKDAWVCQRF